MHERPNIILLVLDTHRVERMSIYGYHRETTPVIDDFAADSMVFDRAIATAQWTVPSHASMFTGLYPTVHKTNQSYTALPDDIPTLAELLQAHGYTTVGFCNNPLVGVLDNGLRRGFDQFYNYAATIPDSPIIGRELGGLQRTQRAIMGTLQGFTTLIERQFGRSPLLLKLAMMPVFVPLWSRFGKFKGDTDRSLRDVADFLRYYWSSGDERPLFMFINMMETHLPYYPPRQYADRWVPYLRREQATREFVQRFNSQSYRWLTPMSEPFTDWQQRVLGDLYDAEIAYQDRQLRRLFRYLKRSGELDNTMVIVVSDHGESHGEHSFMGHAFVVYSELVHVPLIIHYPALFPVGERTSHTTSTRRIFHTVLEAAGVPFEQFGYPITKLSLARTVEGNEPEDEQVVCEAFPPPNFINVMEMNNPEAIEPFRVRMMRRAIYDGGHKLMTVDGRPDEFFDVAHDPFEETNLLDAPGYENDILRMERMLEEFVVVAEAHRDGTAAGRELDLSDNPELLERLRGLGYIE